MKKSQFFRPAMLLLALAAYVWALGCWVQTRQGAQVTCYLVQPGITGARAEELWQRELEQPDPAAFCFWEQTPQQQAQCPLTGRSAAVTLVQVKGNPELLDAGALAWQDGCYVDEQTAQTLFGTRQCGGQILIQDGREYPVLGVIPGAGPTLVRLARPEETLSRCVLPREGVQTGLMRWGLTGRQLDWTVLAALSRDLLVLLPGILLVWLCRRLSRGWRQLSLSQLGRQKPLLGRTTLALLLALAGLWALLAAVEVPQDMIPSRWSDFSFWGKWWSRQKENALLLLTTPLGNQQLQMLTNMVKSMVLSTGSAVLTLVGLAGGKPAAVEEKEEAPCES